MRGHWPSYLVEITGKVLQATDPETGAPMSMLIVDSEAKKVPDGWTLIRSAEARQIGPM